MAELRRNTNEGEAEVRQMVSNVKKEYHIVTVTLRRLRIRSWSSAVVWWRSTTISLTVIRFVWVTKFIVTHTLLN